MSNLRQEHAYQELADAIRAAGGVPCEEIPEIFWPEDYSDPGTRQVAIKTAKALCASCPVKTECFTYAIENEERYGIWAGTLPHER
jgi:WhiB family transcriptional regulator, redox-sensing transcriptional regulator